MKYFLEKICMGFLIGAIVCGIAIAVVIPTARAVDGDEGSNSSAINTAIGLEPVFENLIFQNPVVLLQSPGGEDTWYVVEQAGMVRYFSPGDNLPRTFANMHPNVAFRGEQGLLGMAFHPAYPDIPYVYLSYTNTDDESIVSRLTLDAETGKLDEGSEQVILRVAQPFANHNGGNIAFGPDGFLYIGFGDGGSAGDPTDQAQNTKTLLGAMLRIDVDTATPYAIVSGNPFSGDANCDAGDGCPEIFAWGFRNPWRWSFDRESGTLWVGDVGQSSFEEVDIIEVGKNYGWRCFEGNHAFDATNCDLDGEFIAPVFQYGRDNGRCSITGGYVYRGKALPEFAGTYLFADYCTGEIFGLVPSEGGFDSMLLADADFSIVSFAEDNDGELYVLGRTGEIRKIVPEN